MKNFIVKEWAELISDPIIFNDQSCQVFEHVNLPKVKDELSVTLRLKIQKLTSCWATILHKGTKSSVRTLRLELMPNKFSLLARFTGNWTDNAGIHDIGDELLLDRWYYVAYTLSDSEKRADLYVDSEWVGSYSIHKIKKQKIVFNDAPLYIGRSYNEADGFNGKISNVRYFNWRLCAEEVKEHFFNNKIAYDSKVALVHVPTGKYLSTKGIKYDSDKCDPQYMVVGNGWEIDLNNDVFTVIEAFDTSVSAGSSVPFNTLVGFKHQATGGILHSHTMYYGSTPLMKHQQVTIWPKRNNDDDWLIRRYNSKEDSSYLSDGDIIILIHDKSNKTALYSHPMLFGDGTQEVSYHGNGNDENNKVKSVMNGSRNFLPIGSATNFKNVKYLKPTELSVRGQRSTSLAVRISIVEVVICLSEINQMITKFTSESDFYLLKTFNESSIKLIDNRKNDVGKTMTKKFY
ncbi:9766_t:CDS:2 [Funneliformis caledonium]|uniref:9766_t:CDS:1 n=1 Tax=Funneliformis caledonium TaxID=1117310 RepID=A0A9N9ARN8_9GLOM|nr:9766_t:CDS:2 [Funneliformis caledonium]